MTQINWLLQKECKVLLKRECNGLEKIQFLGFKLLHFYFFSLSLLHVITISNMLSACDSSRCPQSDFCWLPLARKALWSCGTRCPRGECLLLKRSQHINILTYPQKSSLQKQPKSITEMQMGYWFCLTKIIAARESPLHCQKTSEPGKTTKGHLKA